MAGLVSFSTDRVKRGKADYMGTADEIQENVGGLGKRIKHEIVLQTVRK